MSQIKEIIDGWSNYALKGLNLLDENVKEIGKKRISICNSCNIRTHNFCSPRKQGKHKETGKLINGCGCLLNAKVLSLDSTCPLGKW